MKRRVEKRIRHSRCARHCRQEWRCFNYDKTYI